jgi:uncharacterized membrane protein YkoI
MQRIVRVARNVSAGALLVAGVAQGQATKSQQTLAGIETATPTGRPISSQYEVEDGKLQLSVFTENGGAFTEVFVDHMTGKVAKTEKITSGDDLKDAKAQNRAMAKAKSTLAEALAKALAENAGYTAVEITPVLEGGHPVAEITLMKGGQFKSVSEPLG